MIDFHWILVYRFSSSKLADIFGVALQAPPKESNESLQYTRPKAEQKAPAELNESNSKPVYQPIIAKIVSAYKLLVLHS